jgi:hypothetical protein
MGANGRALVREQFSGIPSASAGSMSTVALTAPAAGLWVPDVKISIVTGPWLPVSAVRAA